jgi:hypothetical protein
MASEHHCPLRLCQLELDFCTTSIITLLIDCIKFC